MVVAKIEINGTTASVIWSKEIPAGLVGGRVQIEYTDDRWNSLQKTVVFRGAETRDVADNGNEVVIPAEVLSQSGKYLYVGVYGTDTENEIGLPTFWAKLGIIRDAADPERDPNASSSLPIWAQLLERTPDWQAQQGNTNHILNRTHWFETEIVDHTFDGDLTGRTVVAVEAGFFLVKVSDAILTADDLVGEIMTISVGGVEFSEAISEDDIHDLNVEGVPAVAVGEAVICVQQNFSFYGSSYDSGVYFLCTVDNEGNTEAYVKHLSAIPPEREIVHKLDNKYLDAEWVATRTDGSENVLMETSYYFYSSGTCEQTFSFSLEPGENYLVGWDYEHNTYPCKRVAIQGFQLPYIGNLHYFDEEFPDTGEPFCFINIAILFLNLGTMLYTAPADSDTYYTVSLTRVGNVRQRIPLDYLPAVYTFPADLSDNDVDNDLLAMAYFHMQKGGAVNAIYQGDIYQVLAINVDIFDGWYDSLVLAGEGCIRIWHKRKGWFSYEPHRFSLCSPGYDEPSRSGKKYEVTIDENGQLQTRDITEYS